MCVCVCGGVGGAKYVHEFFEHSEAAKILITNRKDPQVCVCVCVCVCVWVGDAKYVHEFFEKLHLKIELRVLVIGSAVMGFAKVPKFTF